MPATRLASFAPSLALVACLLAASGPGCDDSSEEPGPEGPPAVNQGGRPNYCLEVRCPAGTVCNEATDLCDTADFCASVSCPLGTACNEQTDSCDPLTATPDDFCSSSPCPPDTVCNETTDSCDQLIMSDDFCATVICPPGTTCNEINDSCDKR